MSLVDEDRDRPTHVVPATDILRSVSLFPKFGASVPREWTSDSVLDDCSIFYVNPFSDPHSYVTITGCRVQYYCLQYLESILKVYIILSPYYPA